MHTPPLRLAVLTVALLLGGCASQGDTAPSSTAETPSGDANSHLVIAEIALQRGEYADAAREYAAAAQLSADPQLAEQATRVAFSSRQNESAALSARRWLELVAENADAHRFMAVIALRLHRIDEAAREFGHLLRTTYASPAEGFLDLTAVLAEEDNAYGAFLVMSHLARAHSKIAQGHYALGVAALRSFNYEAAVNSSRRALEIAPDLIDAERILVRALVVSGRTEEGIDRARARAQSGSDLEAQMEVPLLLVAAGKDEAARTELARLLEIPAARPEALRSLATLELASGNLDEASRHFQELAGTGNNTSLAFYFLGAIHERRRDATHAINYYARVVSEPYAVDAQLRAARLLATSGAREQANNLLDDFIVEHPETEVEITIGRARLLAEEGDAETALELIDSARARYPDSEALQYARSLTLERLERVGDALTQLRAVLRRRPGDPVALNALGYTLAEHNVELKEARSLVRKALDLTPDNPAVQDSMGWVQHRLGQHRDAITWLERAYATEKDGEIAAHIGEVYWALGDRSKARAVWEKALEEDPDHRYLLRTLQQHPETSP